MKISEIIVESREGHQLDEGMMDTIKSKLNSVYQMARKKYPNFDEVFAVAKSHKSEINDIIEQLKAKKETGKLSKEDVVAAIMPLSKKVAAEVGDKGVVNEDDFGNAGNAIIGAGVGLLASPITYLILNMIGDVSFGVSLFISVAFLAAYTVLYEAGSRSSKLASQEKFDKLSPEQQRKENAEMERKKLQKEYDDLEHHYKRQHELDSRGRPWPMSYAQKRRMEELYNQGFR